MYEYRYNCIRMYICSVFKFFNKFLLILDFFYVIYIKLDDLYLYVNNWC